MLRQRARDLTKGIARSRGRELTRWPVPGTFGEHLAMVLSTYRINLVLDVGANDGDYARFLRSIGYQSWIVSFEPTRAAFRRLSARARHDSRWLARRGALGSSEGLAEMNVLANDKCSSLLAPLHTGQWDLATGWDLAESLALDHTEEVRVQRLDTLFDDVAKAVDEQPRALLKLDTQGYDVEVFRGASGCLSAIPALQSEVSVQPIYAGMPTMHEALDVYRVAGYAENGFFAVSLDAQLAALEFDCLLVNPALMPAA